MKGIEFLKKIGRIEEEMISEAANPVKKSRKWNGNIIKFVGLAACIAVFVGAICIGRVGVYLKNAKGPMSSVTSGDEEKTTGNIEDISEAPEKQEESATKQTKAGETISKRMVMLDGKLYVDVGESDIDARCGMLDGSIDSSVESGKSPETNYQSNFGSGYGYQRVAQDSIDVNIDGQWIRFETLDNGEQEAPFDKKEPVTEEYTGPIETVRPARFEVSLNVDSITSEGAEFLIINIGYEHASTGMDFCIEKLVNGNWVDCDYVNEPAWQEKALLLGTEKEIVFYADWSKIYGSLEKGTYRLRKNVYGDDETQEIYCPFTL